MILTRSDGATVASISTVEVQRLQAVVDTQRRHIEELNKQLHETLEVKRQQQLQLVERSPAPRNVKQLLARAAADNTALAKKVEELRAQRNALAVTKAALTAQLSELIRGAANDVQREQQNHMLLRQLQHLCCYIGRHDLQDPSQQMAAVIKHVQKVQHTQQELAQEAARHKQAVAATDTSMMVSPTGGRSLDQTATSQLVWDSGRCSDLFPAAVGTAATSAAVDITPPAEHSLNWSASCNTARSYFTDLSYISPLRSGSKPGHEPTPCSRTPDGTALTGASGTARCAAFAEEDDESPLSTQSLSMFSPSKAATPGCGISPRRLDLATPVSKYAPGAAEGSSTIRKPETCADPGSRDAEQRDQQLLQTEEGNSPQLSMMMMSPVYGFNPEDLQCPSAIHPSAAGGSSCPAAASTAQHTTGLSLEAEFRLAACDSLWPSPGLTEDSLAAVHGTGMHTGSCPSHMLWLPEDGSSSSPVPARVLAWDFSPMPTRLGGSSRQAVSPLSVWFGQEGYEFDLCGQEEQEQQQQQQQCGKRRRRWLVTGLCLVAPLTVAVAVGSAAAWQFKRNEVLQIFTIIKCGAGLAAQHTQHSAAAGWKHCQQKAGAAWMKVRQYLQRQPKRG